MRKYDFKLDIYGDNTIAWIANRVENKSKILEFGSANGRLTKYLSEEKQCEVDIVEIDKVSGREAAEYAHHAWIGCEEGDIENYMWMDTTETYDFLIFADVLEHLIHPKEVLKRCGAVMKENGRILVSIPNASHNSVIIQLFNDQFDYTPTGILDNTHLKFFTRNSFEKMAQEAGWTIIEEKAKQNRVGENEISCKYDDVSKDLFKELVHRPTGNIYQYMFVLAPCEDYLQGKCDQLISIDSTSYYYIELQFEQNGVWDYLHSVKRHFDPYYKYIDLSYKVVQRCNTIKVIPINSNCILKNVRISCRVGDSAIDAPIVSLNGIQFGNSYYFENNPEFVIDLLKGTNEIKFEAELLQYDFDTDVYKLFFNEFIQKEKALRCQLIENSECYEIEISRRETERLSLVDELEKSRIELRESKNLIQKKEEEISQLKETIRRKEEEISQLEETIRSNSEDSLLYCQKINSIQSMQKKELEEVCLKYEEEIQRRENERNMFLREIEERKMEKEKCEKSVKKSFRIFMDSFKYKMPRKTLTIKKTEVVKRICNKSITAVIPNYNYARYLQQRLDSILFQTYPVKEIIILDDCSKDNSMQVIDQYLRDNNSDIPISVIKNDKNSGSVFAQWQKAFQFAKTDYVWIAEADDSSNEKFLETVMQGFDDPEVVMSYCESLTIDEDNRLLMGDLRVWIDIFKTGKWNQSYVNDGTKEIEESMCINNTIANVSSVVFRNDDYEEILENAKSYKLAGDWYTYMNVLKRGKIAYFKDSLNYHRMQRQGLTLSTSHEQEFEEIVRLQDFAMDNFNIQDKTKEKVYERREKERKRFGL